MNNAFPLHRDQQFDVTTSEGLRITPSDTTKILNERRGGSGGKKADSSSTLEKIWLEQGDIFFNSVFMNDDFRSNKVK